MATSLVPLLDSALTELEALERRLESENIGDSKLWPPLSLALRKLASTSVELINIPETLNRTNRAMFISFCARLKAAALIFSETINTRDSRPTLSHSLPGSSRPGRSSKPPSVGRISGSSISAANQTDALLLPELSTYRPVSLVLIHCLLSPFSKLRFVSPLYAMTTLKDNYMSNPLTKFLVASFRARAC